jgi:hypothetical protein
MANSLLLPVEHQLVVEEDEVEEETGDGVDEVVDEAVTEVDEVPALAEVLPVDELPPEVAEAVPLMPTTRRLSLPLVLKLCVHYLSPARSISIYIQSNTICSPPFVHSFAPSPRGYPVRHTPGLCLLYTYTYTYTSILYTYTLSNNTQQENH